MLLAASVAALIYTPVSYRSQALFNVIFFKLAPESAAPRQVLQELGLGEPYWQYIGTHAFMAGSPVNDPEWDAEFSRHTGYGAVLRFYLRHPGRALQVLQSDLRLNAVQMRSENLSNFRRVDGHPPGALTQHFASWSNLRSGLYRRWPGHIAVWYALLILFALKSANRKAAAVCLGIAAMAILEFCFASLADACETYRHLLLFHLLTDITICFALGWVFQPAAVR